MNVKTLLEEEIRGEFEGLNELEVGSKEYRTTVDGLTKLIDRAIEIEKMESESDEKVENRVFDNDLKLKQLDEEKKDRLIKNCISVAGIVIPSAITIWGTFKTFKFEEEGTITTTMGRGFINRLFPKK